MNTKKKKRKITYSQEDYEKFNIADYEIAKMHGIQSSNHFVNIHRLRDD